MRRIRYAVAASVDGFITGPGESIDWIVMDPDVDMSAKMAEFDTLLVGRRTYELMRRSGNVTMPGMKTVVCSTTLEPGVVKGVEIIGDRIAERVSAMREGAGKDIWLFGGASLFGSLLKLGLVDTVEVAVMPALLGAGIPLLPAEHAGTRKLRLIDHRVYPKTGTVVLQYAIEGRG